MVAPNVCEEWNGDKATDLSLSDLVLGLNFESSLSWCGFFCENLARDSGELLSFEQPDSPSSLVND